MFGDEHAQLLLIILKFNEQELHVELLQVKHWLPYITLQFIHKLFTFVLPLGQIN